jgi:uncharacterized membrane protein
MTKKIVGWVLFVLIALSVYYFYPILRKYWYLHTTLRFRLSLLFFSSIGLLLIFFIIMIITCMLIAYVVRKDIEKKYK